MRCEFLFQNLHKVFYFHTWFLTSNLFDVFIIFLVDYRNKMMILCFLGPNSVPTLFLPFHWMLLKLEMGTASMQGRGAYDFIQDDLLSGPPWHFSSILLILPISTHEIIASNLLNTEIYVC
jgi:hypothetical protein